MSRRAGQTTPLFNSFLWLAFLEKIFTKFGKKILQEKNSRAGTFLLENIKNAYDKEITF